LHPIKKVVVAVEAPLPAEFQKTLGALRKFRALR
jgi:hypothetical protein